MIWRPIRLGTGKPFGEENQRTVWRVPPLAEEAFGRRDLELVAESAEDGAGEKVERVGAVAEEKRFEGNRKYSQKTMKRGQDDGGVMGAEQNGRLEVDGD